MVGPAARGRRRGRASEASAWSSCSARRTATVPTPIPHRRTGKARRAASAWFIRSSPRSDPAGRGSGDRGLLGSLEPAAVHLRERLAQRRRDVADERVGRERQDRDIVDIHRQRRDPDPGAALRRQVDRPLRQRDAPRREGIAHEQRPRHPGGELPVDATSEQPFVQHEHRDVLTRDHGVRRTQLVAIEVAGATRVRDLLEHRRWLARQGLAGAREQLAPRRVVGSLGLQLCSHAGRHLLRQQARRMDDFAEIVIVDRSYHAQMQPGLTGVSPRKYQSAPRLRCIREAQRRPRMTGCAGCMDRPAEGVGV